MATRGPHFDDSSGDDEPISLRSQRPRALQDLELKAMPVTVARDSGCYTGSPMTTNSPVVSGRPRSHFTYEGDSETDASTPSRLVGYRTQSTPLVDDDELANMDMEGVDSDDDDEVFHQSVDSFIDSGLQSMSIHLEGESCARSRLLFRPYKQEDRAHHTESDEETSTSSGDFSTAEFDFDMETPVSDPIDIPARSNNSSPGTDHTEEEDAVINHAATSRPIADVNQPVRRLLRRATVGQLHELEHPATRRTREQEVEARPRSLVGANGPLPDVVPHGMRRNRAMSESAIGMQHVTSVGNRLQRMSDEFSNTQIHKSLSLIQMKQRNPDQVRQGSSYPLAKKKGSVLSRLFSSSHE